MNTIAALFDLEGTLYTARTGNGLLRYAKNHGRRHKTLLFYTSLFPVFFLRKLRLISEEGFLKPAIERFGWMIEGLSLEEGKSVFDWVVHEYILPTGRPDVLEHWHQHREQGHAVVIVSGSLTPVLERISTKLNATGFVGTNLEVKENRYSGRTLEPVIIGDAKDESTRNFFSERNLSIDWDNSYAYADSIHDLSLFELVGRPVAVYPDPDLHKLASERKWEIIGAR